ncbi:uncharacterized protein LOC62_04G005506 [Vanrija pseudolonga]|uniref:Uncharacterized protein n=1 Tax=Vanrija pseudolonga TaxID=143232 RepID=A0AAF1BRC6_9TREE|nr:hypothetical protein LOC62_04G005506 [Vanrija pseudolonga]
MPPRTSAQDQIASLRSELELSTFLNKGVLQSNAEHKLRIAELEAENATLRTAESKLAATEDALEAAEQRVAGLEEAKRRLGERREAALAREVDLRRAAEEERDVWKARFVALASAADRARLLLDVAVAGGEAGPSTPMSAPPPPVSWPAGNWESLTPEGIARAIAAPED